MEFASLGLVLAMSLSSLSFSITPRQSTPKSCGYAAAAGMLSLALKAPQAALPSPRSEPASLRDIAQIFELQGLPAYPYWVEPKLILSAIRRAGPAILHLDAPSDHFILGIVETEGGLLSADPEWGARILSPEELSARASGYLLFTSLQPGDLAINTHVATIEKRILGIHSLVKRTASKAIQWGLTLSLDDRDIHAIAELEISIAPWLRLRMAALLWPLPIADSVGTKLQDFAFESGIFSHFSGSSPADMWRFGIEGRIGLPRIEDFTFQGIVAWRSVEGELARSMGIQGGFISQGRFFCGADAQLLLGIRPDLAARTGVSVSLAGGESMQWRMEVSGGLIFAFPGCSLGIDHGSALSSGRGESRELKMTLFF
jgi:hypothetical protein